MSVRRLGFIGLGNIGGAVCANLLADGHQVAVLDIETARVTAMEKVGGRPAATVLDVAEEADVTFMSLPTPAVMEAVAAEWLPAGKGKILVDLTTNAPATVRAVGARLTAGGASLVEAPLTGGAPGAQARALVFIVGGDPEPVAELRPILDTIGRATFHLGPLGCGNVGKLLNSLLAFSATWASIEALALAARHDIDLRTVLEMVRTGGASNFYIDRLVESIGAQDRPTTFALELAAKDAGLMVELGRETTVPLPLASAVLQVLVLAGAQGLGERDYADLPRLMEKLADLEFRLRPPDSAD
ncbi:MAG TPA: NAD(P)-dependent oxidoreductase [Acidimicrobiales bacterium]|nr:NAD(P)-dependent oxidoreductase [Acidimicrobiales bacterium]